MTYLISFLVITNISFVMYVLRLHYEKGGVCEQPVLEEPIIETMPNDLLSDEIISSLTINYFDWIIDDTHAKNKERSFTIWRDTSWECITINGRDIFTEKQKNEIKEAIDHCICYQILYKDLNKKLLEIGE